jgi:hypothetical protein
VEQYVVAANATFYSVTVITTSTSGTIQIPFTLTFELDKYSKTFFRPTGQILLTVNITGDSSDTSVGLHFDDGTSARTYTSVSSSSNSQQVLRFLDNIETEDTLELQDVLFFSFNLPSPATASLDYAFSAELYSGDCLGCENPGATTVDRTPIFEGSVALVPPGELGNLNQ